MADAQGPGWGAYGQSGISFTALISALQANQEQMTAVFNTLNGLIKNLGLLAPTYATGTWTPADNSGAALVFTGVSANYTQVGRMIFAYAQLTYPATADASNASLSGLPVATANAAYATGPAKAFCSAAVDAILRPVSNASTAAFLSGATGAAVLNSALSGATVSFLLTYPTS